VTFYQNGVKARLGNREARARYGDVLDLGTVRFAVTSVPEVPSATLQVIPHQMAADKLMNVLTVVPRVGTDVIDVTYMSSNPRLAQRVVNTTVTVLRTSPPAPSSAGKGAVQNPQNRNPSGFSFPQLGQTGMAEGV
jgi:hypothetical protein